MPFRKGRKGKKRAPRRKVYRKKRRYNKIQSIKVRAPGAICGDRTFVKLVYYDQTNSTLTNTGNAIATMRYRPSSAFDVNPLLGTTAMSGYAELSNLYNKYRVHGAKITASFCNMEDFGVVICCLPLNVDPGTSPAGSVVQSWQMQPFAYRKVLAAKGGLDKCTVSRYIASKKIVGSNTFRYEENYASDVTTIPVDNWFYAISATTMGGYTFINNGGVQYNVRITCYVEFYDRKQLTA